MLFVLRGVHGIAVDRSAGRGEEDLLESVLPAGFEQVQEAADVDLGVEFGIGDGGPHVELSGVMHEHLVPVGGEQGRTVGISDVVDEQGHVGGKIFASAAR